MGRFTDWLLRKQPRTGRMVTEDGEFWNHADRLRFLERYDITYQTVENGAVRMSTVQRGLQQGMYYFGLRVPAGRRLVVYYRALVLTEGVFEIDIISPADGFTGGTIATKSRLNPDSSPTVQSDLYYNVTPAGAITVIDEDFVDTGVGVGSSRIGGVPAVDETFVIVTGEQCLRIDSEGADPYSAALRLVAWEEDIPA